VGGCTTGLWSHLKCVHRQVFHRANAIRNSYKQAKLEALGVDVKEEPNFDSEDREVDTSNEGEREGEENFPWDLFYNSEGSYTCLLCNEALKSTDLSATELWNHLSANHKLEFDQAKSVTNERKRLKLDESAESLKENQSPGTKAKLSAFSKIERNPVWNLYKRGEESAVCLLCYKMINTAGVNVIKLFSFVTDDEAQ